MTETETQERIDITRWNRAKRRTLKFNSPGKLMGRNLPYVKAVHGTVESYNKLREAELAAEKAKDVV